MPQINSSKQFWEYLLLVSPPENTRKFIGNIKKEVGIKYNSSHALNSAAYISLIKFLITRGHEKYMLNQLFGFCMNKLPFNVELNNFGLFPRHTLYINVTENDRLRKLQDGLLVFLKNVMWIQNGYAAKTGKFHLTIAGNLTPRQFDLIAGEYRNKTMSTSFLAKCIVLLKRPYEANNIRRYRWWGNHTFLLGN